MLAIATVRTFFYNKPRQNIFITNEYTYIENISLSFTKRHNQTI